VPTLTRAELLGRTVKGGAAFALAGAVLSVADAPAATAGIGPADIPVVTLALAGELLGAEFYEQALLAKVFPAEEMRHLKRAQFNDSQHYSGLAQILSHAGQTPGQASDFDFTFPAKGFATRKSAAALGTQLETEFLGIYLGGTQTVQNADVRSLFARIAASQAEHLSLLSAIAFGKPIGMSFPLPLTVEQGSAALDPFIS